jgi:hypothetical protein
MYPGIVEATNLVVHQYGDAGRRSGHLSCHVAKAGNKTAAEMNTGFVVED